MAKKHVRYRQAPLNPAKPTTHAQAMAYLKSMMKADPAPRELSADGYVYFCGPDGGPIKIGYSADPEERLYRLQTASAERLYLWATAPGGRKAEDRYHALFAGYNIGREWFTRSPEIEAEISRLQVGGL